jgi:hypothetical protein
MNAPNRAIFTDEYCDGWQAFHAGQPIASNPHATCQGLYYCKCYDWRAGWCDAAHQVERIVPCE